jgi:ribosomal protein L29/BMFP domain-containing protein YqiC
MNEKNMMTKGAAWKESPSMDELKPCPFCGCTQVLVSQRDGVPLIACNECWGENRTIKAWNRREEVTALEAEVERLKAKLNAVTEERGEEFRQYRRSAQAYEKEAIRLKEAVKSLPEFTWKAERYREVCDVLKRPQGEDVVEMVESIKKEWLELRAEKTAGTTISVEQAKEASQLASQAAAVHTVRACAQWLRINGWHNSVRDTAIEMERLMVEHINQTYGTPGMCVPPKEDHEWPATVTKPEFDKLCARVEALEQKLSLAVKWEKRYER